jgi:hypothetical protein
MTIQISHAPPAQSYGGMGVLAGNAQYNRELYPQLVQQDQFAQQMQQRENAMLFQAAVQAQEQERRQQFGAILQQRAQDQQLRLGQQHGDYALAQSYLHDQSQYANQRNLFDHQMNRDQAAQEARAALELQHQQNVLARQTEYQDQRRQAEESQVWKERFANPFSEYDTEVAKLTQAGMQYAPGDQERLQSIRGDIEKMSTAVQRGQFFDNDVLPQFQARWAAMNRIKPSIPKQTVQDLWKEEAVDVYAKKWTGQMDDAGQPVMVDDPTQHLGTVTKNQKGQWVQTVRPVSGGKAPGQQQGQGGEQDDPWAMVAPEKQVAAVETIRAGVSKNAAARANLLKTLVEAERAALPEGATVDMARIKAEVAREIPDFYNESNVPPMIRDSFKQRAAQSQPAVQQQSPQPEPYSMKDAHTNETFVRSSIALGNGAAAIMDKPDVGPEATQAIMGQLRQLNELSANVKVEQWSPELRQSYAKMIEFARRRVQYELDRRNNPGV